MNSQSKRNMPHEAGAIQKLPEGIRQKLTDYRSLVRKIKIGEGILAGLFGFLASYAMIFAIDRFVETPHWCRLLFFLCGLIGFGLYLPYMLHRWIWNTRQLESVARLLAHSFPSLSDHVLSIVELAKNSDEQKRSPQLIAAAMAQVDDRLCREDLSKGVPNPKLKRWLFGASPFVLVALGIAIVVPSVAQNTWSRFLFPWADIDRYTFARFEKLPNEIVVPYGEPSMLHVSLRPDSDWKPKTAKLAVAKTRLDANQVANNYEFSVPGQLEQLPVSLRVGDATQTMQLVPMVRPELSQIIACISLPEYLQHSEPQLLPVKSSSVSILKGSSVSIQAKATRELSAANATIRTLPETPVEIADKEDNRNGVSQTSLSVDGDSFMTESMPFAESSQLELDWKDTHGLSGSKKSQFMLRGIDDFAPVVSCSGLPDPLVLLHSELLTFQVNASDDFGLKHIGIEWSSASSDETTAPVKGERLVIAGNSTATKLSGLATLSCKNENIVPQRLQIRAFTEDLKPDRGRIYSVPYVIHIMSAEEHAQWIAEQLRRWKAKTDAIYEEELRLLDENRQIRDLAAGDIDSESTRERMKNQASAERDNAKRLENAVEDGAKILEQALRNEEIRSKQVEDWARSLQKLNELSKERMPDVAEQIGRVGESPATKSSASKPSDSDSSSPPSLRDNEKSPYDKRPAEGSGGGAGGGSSLPETQLGPGATEKESGSDKEKDSEEKNETNEKMDRAVKDQSKLIEEFRKAKQAFEQLMADFENSTFVKRLKSSSRFQKEIANLLTQAIGSNFGLSSSKAKAAQQETEVIMQHQRKLAESIAAIQGDLTAYQNNNPSADREAVLKDMKDQNTQIKLEEMPLRMERNLRGDALNRSEYWADTFDRWAEELAGPGSGGGGGGGGGEEKDKLPPAILLEIMRIIGDEIDLRDETRTLNQLWIPDQEMSEDLQDRTTAQAVEQMAIQERTLHVIQDIQALPNGSGFGEELQKLNKGVQAMDDASSMLSDLRLGENVIAAETAAIEALIEAKRGGGGGGAGGSTPGMGGDGGTTDRSPLDMIGPGSDRNAKVAKRQVGEATGKTGRTLPEQYRRGLDEFLNKATRR